MMKYKQRDIIIIDVPYSERTGIKKRPALIISNEKYHTKRQEVIIAAITSNIKKVLPGDTKIEKWESANLKLPSLVTGIIQTIKHQMIFKNIGELSTNDFSNVKTNFKSIFSF